MFRNPLIDALVVLLVVLLIFGPKRLPQLGKSLGHGMREFKDGITGSSKADEEEPEERPELTQASASVPAGETPAPQPAAEPQPSEVGSAERRS